jgi:hypothetical protein
MRGIIVLGVLLMAIPPALAVSDVPIVDTNFPTTNVVAPYGGAPITVSCNGVAPGTNTCTTGSHLAISVGTAPLTLTHGFTGVNFAGYTGTVESTLSWNSGTATGARTFRCNVNNGALSCLGGSGAFPPNGPSIITQTCSSYNIGTLTPGGSGNWGCIFTYTGIKMPA